jgi:hypothetical protein
VAPCYRPRAPAAERAGCGPTDPRHPSAGQKLDRSMYPQDSYREAADGGNARRGGASSPALRPVSSIVALRGGMQCGQPELPAEAGCRWLCATPKSFDSVPDIPGCASGACSGGVMRAMRGQVTLIQNDRGRTGRTRHPD